MSGRTAWRSAAEERLRRLAYYCPPSLLYCATVCSIAFVELINWPIASIDTDLWYHLSGGRYILDHGRLPIDSYFSFLQPPRPFVDYYWLFQVLVVSVFRNWDYLGLVVLRAGLFLAVLGVVSAFLYHRAHRAPTLSWPDVVFAVVVPFLVPRFLNLRPHCFTYLFIALFVYLLECHPRRVAWLPVLAVLWCNFHGISYPILWLIAGVYGIEVLIGTLRGRPDPDRAAPGYLTALTLCLLAPLATPHGWRLLGVPFVPVGEAMQFIAELAPLNLATLTSFSVSGLTPSYVTLFNVLLIATALALVSGLGGTLPRLRHVLLSLGGGALLLHGNRFAYEFVLLALPLLKASPPFGRRVHAGLLPPAVRTAIALMVMVLPVLAVKMEFVNSPRYPFTSRGLPVGVAAFLDRVPEGATIWVHPDLGGYYQWTAFPRHRISMDMEVPFMFSIDDLYQGTQAFGHEPVLRRVVEQYHPSAIAVSIEERGFPERIKAFPDYVPVFFDDLNVLYLSRSRYPDLTQRFDLGDLDPFALLERRLFMKGTAEELEPLLRRARTLLAIYPHQGMVRHALARMYIEEGAYDRALPHASDLAASYPESAHGFRLLGDAYRELGALPRAAQAYEAALERDAAQPELARNLGRVYLQLGRYEAAYRKLEAGVSISSDRATAEQLYWLAVAARRSGRLERARTAWGFSMAKAPADATDLRRRLLEERARLDAQQGR